MRKSDSRSEIRGSKRVRPPIYERKPRVVNRDGESGGRIAELQQILVRLKQCGLEGEERLTFPSINDADQSVNVKSAQLGIEFKTCGPCIEPV